MGGGQPYLYSSPRYSALDPLDPFNGFNPRAVTQASQMPPSPPRPKPEGPLINFNRHPDSYLVLPHRRSDVAPMSPNTKSRIKWARKVQLALRVPLILGAIGMLICVICVRGTKDAEGWILRLPVSDTSCSRGHQLIANIGMRRYPNHSLRHLPPRALGN
jgi:hypothetical protein